jgi:hypothetical protein
MIIILYANYGIALASNHCIESSDEIFIKKNLLTSDSNTLECYITIKADEYYYSLKAKNDEFDKSLSDNPNKFVIPSHFGVVNR